MKKLIVSIGLIIIPVIILMILGVFILNIGTVATFFSGVLFMATALNQYAGINIWLARAITATVLFVGYYYGLRNILSLRGNKGIGYGALIILWSVVCLSMYATQGNFSRTKGEAVKYYFKDYKGRMIIVE